MDSKAKDMYVYQSIEELTYISKCLGHKDPVIKVESATQTKPDIISDPNKRIFSTVIKNINYDLSLFDKIPIKMKVLNESYVRGRVRINYSQEMPVTIDDLDTSQFEVIDVQLLPEVDTNNLPERPELEEINQNQDSAEFFQDSSVSSESKRQKLDDTKEAGNME